MSSIGSSTSIWIRALMIVTINARPTSQRSRTVSISRGGGYSVFCNPPYGREIGKWVKKAYEEGHQKNTVVVMLIPARTDTKYFHDYINHRAEVRFISGRLKFGDSKNSAPFPSMVVIFRGPGM